MPAKTKKIEFIKSPTGRFKLAYHVGAVVALPTEQADELIELQYAVPVKVRKTAKPKPAAEQNDQNTAE